MLAPYLVEGEVAGTRRRARPDPHGLPQGAGRGRRPCRNSSAGSSPAMTERTLMTTDFYEVLGVPSTHRTTRSRRRTARSPASTTPTPTPTITRPPSASRRSTRRTRRCATPNAAGATTCSAPRATGPTGGAPFGAGQFGLNDLFDAFFGGRRVRQHAGRETGPVRGADAEIVDRADARRGRLRRPQDARAAHADRVREVRRLRLRARHARRDVPDVRGHG